MKIFNKKNEDYIFNFAIIHNFIPLDFAYSIEILYKINFIKTSLIFLFIFFSF